MWTSSESGVQARTGRSKGRQATPLWLAAIFVMLTLGLQLWPGASGLLRFYRPDYESGALWQLLTAQWVHLSGWHAAGNALAFLVIVFASGVWLRWPLQALALCGGYAGVTLVVAFDPNCRYYAGASGALHGLLAGNAVAMLWSGGLRKQSAGEPLLAQGGASPRAARHLAIGVLGLLAFKLWLQADRAGVAASVAWGFPVYQPAHIAGALGGMSLVLGVLAARAWAAAKEAAERGQ